MEYKFDTNGVLKEEITILVGGRRGSDSSPLRSERERCIAEIVDTMGIASAKAQGLLSAITSYAKLNLNHDTLYVLKGQHDSKSKGVVIGIIKTGRRKLFLSDYLGRQREVEPISILDFYVHESRQKCGYGKKLFEFMLKNEGLQAWEVAIDRPSYKFLNFLKKNYGLTNCINQANRYVVFDKFFETCKELPQTSRYSSIRQRISSSSNDCSKLSDREAPNHIPSSKPTPSISAADSQVFQKDKPDSLHVQPLPIDCATDVKASNVLDEAGVDTGEGVTGANMDGDVQSTSSTSSLGKPHDKIDQLRKTPEANIRHPQMSSLKTSTRNDLPAEVEVQSFPRTRKVGISSLATSGFGINSLGLTSTTFRTNDVRTNDVRTNDNNWQRRSLFTNIHDNHRSSVFGGSSMGNASSDSSYREEVAPYLNMRQIKNGRRKSDITSHSYLAGNYSAAPSYSRHHMSTGGSQHILQCTQPNSSDSMKTTQFSPQAKPKDNWRQFIT